MSPLVISAICIMSPVQTGELQVHTETDVAVPTRDGVALRAVVHRPDRGGPYPVLVMRTPYSKQGRRFQRFVKAGYVVVCQDARGHYQSEDQWESFVRPETHDAQDGYDTVKWAAQLPGSNGKVGTFGACYNAFLQWRTAALRPPSLKCASDMAKPPMANYVAAMLVCNTSSSTASAEANSPLDDAARHSCRVQAITKIIHV